MFKITSLRSSDGGGAVRIDFRREGERKPESLYILTLHQREYEFAPGEYPDEAYDVLLRLDGICRAVRSGRRILGYGANSRSALRMKLIGKGIKPEYADCSYDSSHNTMPRCQNRLNGEVMVNSPEISTLCRLEGSPSYQPVQPLPTVNFTCISS